MQIKNVGVTIAECLEKTVSLPIEACVALYSLKRKMVSSQKKVTMKTSRNKKVLRASVRISRRAQTRPIMEIRLAMYITEKEELIALENKCVLKISAAGTGANASLYPNK